MICPLDARTAHIQVVGRAILHRRERTAVRLKWGTADRSERAGRTRSAAWPPRQSADLICDHRTQISRCMHIQLEGSDGRATH